MLNDETRLWLWRDLVIDAVRDRYAANSATSEKAAVDAARLLRYLDASGVEDWDGVSADLVLSWCWAAKADRSGGWRRAAVSTARNRQWVARAVFEEAARLGAPISPLAAGEPIRRVASEATTRPLTVEEAHLVRVHADAGLISSRGVLVALAFAGGTASEIAEVRRCDIDLDARSVFFGADAARTNLLDGWGSRTVGDFLAVAPVGLSDRLAVSESLPVARAAHSVTVRLAQVLRDAGLAGRAGVSARSIRLSTAADILERDGIEAAARFLGSPSLDSTADALGYRWRDDA